MTRQSLALVTAAMLMAASCGGNQEQENGNGVDSTLSAPAAVELPGLLISPGGDTLSVGPDTAVVLYYWLPLDLYGQMEMDLLFLASLDSTLLAIPLQPDHETRNHAQRVVNNLGISLPVYLADSSVMEAIDTHILPVTLLLLPGGSPVSESGFGSPARLLAPYIPDE